MGIDFRNGWRIMTNTSQSCAHYLMSLAYSGCAWQVSRETGTFMSAIAFEVDMLHISIKMA